MKSLPSITALIAVSFVTANLATTITDELNHKVLHLLRGSRSSKASAPVVALIDDDACVEGAFYYDDFDDHPLGEATSDGERWSAIASGGSISIAEKDGRKAIRFQTDPSDGYKSAMIRLGGSSNLLPLNGTDAFYGRFNMFLEAAPTELCHWTIIQAGGVVKDQSYRAVYRYGGQLAIPEGSQWMANYDTPDFYHSVGPGTDCWIQADQVVVPTGRWACIEWYFSGEKPAAEMRLWIDNEEIRSLEVDSKGSECVHQDASTYFWASPVFQTLDLGWESYNKDAGERVLWMDDLVLSTNKIGCSA